jgi:uncharacterized membrane protein
MRSTISYVIAVLMSIIVIPTTGCYYDKAELLYTGKINCPSVSAKFSTDVQPIVQNKCATSGCHNASGGAGGTVLETYAQIAAKADRINQRCVVDKTMPTSGPLLPAEIAALKCWIDSGTPNN